MRFFGKVWFEENVETSPGIWDSVLKPRTYIGDVNRYQSRWESQEDSTNDKLTISNEVSIISDSYLMENLGSMRCVEFNSVKWKISSITVQMPRVVLTLGGVYSTEEFNIEDKEVENEEG